MARPYLPIHLPTIQTLSLHLHTIQTIPRPLCQADPTIILPGEARPTLSLSVEARAYLEPVSCCLADLSPQFVRCDQQQERVHQELAVHEHVAHQDRS